MYAYTMQNYERGRPTDAEKRKKLIHVPIWYMHLINVPCPRTTHERLVSRKTTSRDVDLIVCRGALTVSGPAEAKLN